jgi:hypothetical protein
LRHVALERSSDDGKVTQPIFGVLTNYKTWYFTSFVLAIEIESVIDGMIKEKTKSPFSVTKAATLSIEVDNDKNKL